MFVVDSSSRLGGASGRVGVSVAKILSLDIRVCTAHGEYFSSLCVSAVGGL